MASITMDTSETSTSETRKNATVRKAFITWWDVDKLPQWDDVSTKLKFYAYCHETCPTTGKAHVHIVAIAKTAMKIPGWQKLFNPVKKADGGQWWDFQVMRGTLQQCEKYMNKENAWQTFGTPPEQGKRNDLEEVRELLATKKPMQIADEHPEQFTNVMRYHVGFEKYYQYKRQKQKQDDREMPDVYVRIGPPGTGKTKWLACPHRMWCVLQIYLKFNRFLRPESLMLHMDIYMDRNPVLWRS